MVIGVDAGCLGIKDKRLQVGVYTVAKNLLLHLKTLDPKNLYILYSFYPIDPQLMKQLGGNFQNCIVRPSKGWMDLWIPIRVVRDKIDIFLGLNQVIPQKTLFMKYKTIVLFFDLAYEKYPTLYKDSYNKLHKRSLYAAVHADKIVAISDKTRSDLGEIYRIKKDKIDVAHLGIDVKYLTVKRKVSTKMKNYFLFVGAIKKIKNIPNVVKGFEYFMMKTGLNYELIFSGGDKWYDEEITQVMNDLPLNVFNNINFLGHVENTKLYDLYLNAKAFVSPSYYEGFGLCFLEAMACGIPVIGSHEGSIPEIVGNAGILVNPNKPKEIGNAMVRIVQNNELRKKYIGRGKKRVKSFSWERFARKIYHEIEEYES